MSDIAATFGKGEGPTSQLLYRHSFELLRGRIPSFRTVYDLGGGNGMAKAWWPTVITVDNNPAMEPDICADIREYAVPDDAELIVLRYVAHYLSDQELTRLLERVHHKPVLLIQFTNENPGDKYAQTGTRGQGAEDGKTFRTWAGLVHLLEPWGFRQRLRIDYEVEPGFYVERFGKPGAYFAHPETLGVWFKQ